MITNGVKSANQVQFQNQDGEPAVPVIGRNGGLLVEQANGETGGKVLTTLEAKVATVSAEATVINANTTVSEIGVANYSDSADVTVLVNDTDSYIVGAGVALEFPINKNVTTIKLSATSEAKVQYVVTGMKEV